MKRKILLLTILISYGVFAQYSTGTMTFNSLFNGKIDVTSTQVKITLNGPSDRWFSVAFGGTSMGTVNDCLYYNGTTLVDGYLTGYSSPISDTTQNWTLVSNTVTGTTRSIVATRVLNTGDSRDFVFSNSTASYSLIWAYCGSATTNIGSIHGGKGSKTVNQTLGDEDFEASLFKLSSNPIVDNFNVTMPDEIDGMNVRIYDLQGKKCKETHIDHNTNSVSVNELRSGLYILNLDCSKGNYTKKIIIN